MNVKTMLRLNVKQCYKDETEYSCGSPQDLNRFYTQICNDAYKVGL